jgi:hypothetical protein
LATLAARCRHALGAGHDATGKGEPGGGRSCSGQGMILPLSSIVAARSPMRAALGTNFELTLHRLWHEQAAICQALQRARCAGWCRAGDSRRVRLWMLCPGCDPRRHGPVRPFTTNASVAVNDAGRSHTRRFVMFRFPLPLLRRRMAPAGRRRPSRRSAGNDPGRSRSAPAVRIPRPSLPQLEKYPGWPLSRSAVSPASMLMVSGCLPGGHGRCKIHHVGAGRGLAGDSLQPSRPRFPQWLLSTGSLLAKRSR